MRSLVTAAVALVASLGAVNCACPTGWVGYRDSCYQDYNGVKLSWHDARDICMTYPHGDLVAVNDIYENAFLMEQFGEQPFWIGLNDINEEGTYVWSNGEETPYFMNWDCWHERPSGEDDYDCVHLYNFHYGSWSDWTCGTYYPFICEMNMP